MNVENRTMPEPKIIKELPEDCSLVVWEKVRGGDTDIPTGTVGLASYMRDGRTKAIVALNNPKRQPKSFMSVLPPDSYKLYQFENIQDMLVWLYDKLVIQPQEKEGVKVLPEREPIEMYTYLHKTERPTASVLNLRCLHISPEGAMEDLISSGDWRAVKFREVLDEE